jgi:hypothetical protein
VSQRDKPNDPTVKQPRAIHREAYTHPQKKKNLKKKKKRANGITNSTDTIRVFFQKDNRKMSGGGKTRKKC